jgi:hypothetical protein
MRGAPTGRAILAPNADAVSSYSRAGYGPLGILLSKEVAAGGGTRRAVPQGGAGAS